MSLLLTCPLNKGIKLKIINNKKTHIYLLLQTKQIKGNNFLLSFFFSFLFPLPSLLPNIYKGIIFFFLSLSFPFSLNPLFSLPPFAIKYSDNVTHLFLIIEEKEKVAHLSIKKILKLFHIFNHVRLVLILFYTFSSKNITLL